MFSLCSRRFRLQLLFTGVLAGSLYCLPLTGQQPEDSLTIDYDSLQDVRVDRLEWWFSRRLEQLEQARSESVREIDSLQGLLQGVRHRNRELWLENSQQSEQIDELQEEARLQKEASAAYRGRLQNILWATGSVLIALIILSFLYLFFRSERTRNLLARLRGEFKLHRKSYRRELKALTREHKKELRTQRKEQQRELKKRFIKLRRKMGQP